MLSAIVLLTTERDKTNKVAEALADTEGVSEVYSVAGRYDLALPAAGHRRRRDDGLGEDPAVIAVVPTKREDLVGGTLLGQRDAAVAAKPAGCGPRGEVLHPAPRSLAIMDETFMAEALAEARRAESEGDRLRVRVADGAVAATVDA